MRGVPIVIQRSLVWISGLCRDSDRRSIYHAVSWKYSPDGLGCNMTGQAPDTWKYKGMHAQYFLPEILSVPVLLMRLYLDWLILHLPKQIKQDNIWLFQGFLNFRIRIVCITYPSSIDGQSVTSERGIDHGIDTILLINVAYPLS